MNRLSTQHQEIIKSGVLDDKITIFARYWKIEDCEKLKKSLFIFGDNDIKEGCGGQAIIRNCKNTIGIPTKKAPNNRNESFYVDAEYEENCKKIIKAVEDIIMISKNYDELVFPMDGFGTGLAKLSENAPKTLDFIEQLIDECFGVDYKSIRKDGLKVEINPSNVRPDIKKTMQSGQYAK